MNRNGTLGSVMLCFSAGAAGAFANSIFIWLLGALGITAALGVAVAPAMTPAWLYPRLVWGGLWGFLFLLPVLPGSWVLRGLLFSLGPTLVQLFVVFPVKAGVGVMGMDLGVLTPLVVLVVNGVWGLVASYLLERTSAGTAR